jgi:pimeloyl-ACP methyl ester carboxylesterase
MSYQFANINGVRMHYDVQGQGDQPLVLIHAGVANLNIWKKQMAAFSPHFKTLRYDVRGWGETPDPEGIYTDHGDLEALLDHLNIEQAAVLGNSNGGRIAIDFALTYPQRVSKLIAVAPALGGFDYPDDAYESTQSKLHEDAMKSGNTNLAAEIEAQMWFDGPHRKPEQMDGPTRSIAIDLMRHTLELPEGVGEGSLAQPLAVGRLDEIQVPILIMMGGLDIELMLPVGDALEAGIAGARRIDLPDAAHLPSLENPELFNQIVLDFLQD